MTSNSRRRSLQRMSRKMPKCFRNMSSKTRAKSRQQIFLWMKQTSWKLHVTKIRRWCCLLKNYLLFLSESEDEAPRIIPKSVPSLWHVEITQDMLRKVLQKWKGNKSPCLDGIQPRVIKDMTEEMIVPLKIFSNSLNEGVVPEDWGTANIVAIFKKGNKRDPSNYRPVSFSSVFSKLLETFLREAILEHTMSFVGVVWALFRCHYKNTHPRHDGTCLWAPPKRQKMPTVHTG